MRLSFTLFILALFVLAGCSSATGPSSSTPLVTLNCATDLPPSALQTAFANVGVTAPFTLVSSTERKCQYEAGASPNSEMTVGVSIEGSKNEADALELFDRQKSIMGSAGGNPNWAPTTTAKDWNTALGFGSGYYAIKTPAGPVQTTKINLQARANSGQLITIAATYYGDADFTVLGSGAENIAAQVHTIIA